MRRLIIKATLFVFFVCAFMQVKDVYASQEKKEDTIVIGVMSDTHYFSKSLYGDCKDFEIEVNSDRKMIKESNAILDSALDIIVEEMPDVVFITGDLTKDGEIINHRELAKKLEETSRKIREKSNMNHETKFYVINGNHDINNPNGKDFSSGVGIKTEETSTKEFREIYENMGYGIESELYREDNNVGGCLSYVTRIAKGYTLIAVDTGKYSSDQTNSGLDIQETGGTISQPLLNWISQKSKEAKARGDKVLVIQHHGIFPHFKGQGKYMPDYLVDNYEQVCEIYADAGVDMVFTGHMHGNDISKYSLNNNDLYDIETGSLLTYPSPIRIINVDRENNEKTIANIRTRYIKSINYINQGTGEKITNLSEYSKKYILTEQSIKTMISKKIVTPIIDKIIASGGTKKYVANLLEVDENNLNKQIVSLIKSYLPQNKENGIRFSVSNYEFNIYYDGETNRIMLDELLEDKKTPIQLYIDMDMIENKLLDNIYIDIDNMIKSSDTEIDELINSIVDTALQYKIDDSHSLLDFVRQIYIIHLAGEERSPQWVDDYLKNIKQTDTLEKIVKRVLTRSNKQLRTILSKIKLDTKEIIQKGNNGFRTRLVYGLITIKIKDMGNVLKYINIEKLSLTKIMYKIEEYVYGLAYGLCNDTNYIEDNNTSINIKI